LNAPWYARYLPIIAIRRSDKTEKEQSKQLDVH